MLRSRGRKREGVICVLRVRGLLAGKRQFLKVGEGGDRGTG